jgi:hypothetical protein
MSPPPQQPARLDRYRLVVKGFIGASYRSLSHENTSQGELIIFMDSL